MKPLNLIITLIAIFACKMVSAHSLWIETAATGEKNKDQEIKIFYGEYSHQLIEPVEKWYSDVSEFKLFVISPNQEKTEIKTNAHADHFSATFTPTEEGTYILSIEHPAKQPYEITAFEFTAIATIQVGSKSATQAELNLSIHIESKNYKAGETVTAQVKRNNEVFSNAEIEVASPYGWVKSLKANEQGDVSFKAPLVGKYILEVTDTEDKKTDWFGKPIEKIWRANTAVLWVN
jgi:uncharacterized GH25 family protein